MRNPIVADWASARPITKQILSSKTEGINNSMVSFIWRLVPRGNVLPLRQMGETTALVFTADEKAQLRTPITQFKILGSTSETFYRVYVKVCVVPPRTIRFVSTFRKMSSWNACKKITKKNKRLQPSRGGKQSSYMIRNSFH